MYLCAGYITGRMYNQKWEKVVEEKIFKPLGMKSSNFFKEILNEKNYSFPYKLDKDGAKKLPFRNRIGTGPAGGINSNVDDLLNYLQMIVDKGKFRDTQVISSSMLRKLYSPQIPIYYVSGSPIGEINLSGLGWEIQPYENHFLASHGGYIEGYGSDITFLPNEKIVVVILTNTKYSYYFAYFLRYMILGKLLGIDNSRKLKDIVEEIKPSFLESENKDEANNQNNNPVDVKYEWPLKEYIGEYENNAYGSAIINIKENQLFVNFNNQVILPLNHINYNLFESEFTESDYVGRKFRFYFNINKNMKFDSFIAHFENDKIEFSRVDKGEQSK